MKEKEKEKQRKQEEKGMIKNIGAIFMASVAVGYTISSYRYGFDGNIAMVTIGTGIATAAVITKTIRSALKLKAIERDQVIRRWFARLRRDYEAHRAERELEENGRVAELAERRKHFQIYKIEKASKVVDFRYRVATKDCPPFKGRDIVIYNIE